MQVEEELGDFKPDKDMILTIGVFDGVHLGHRHLISKLVTQAHNNGFLSGVVTFRQHPRDLLAPQTRLPYLTTIAERERLLKQAGVDVVIFLSFTKELASLTAREFVSLLQKHLRIRGLVVGPDFALGKNREGNAAYLNSLGQELGFTVTTVPPRKIGGEVASSTSIRNALASGDMHKVTKLLGRSFILQGKVTFGLQRGTGLGFPTANLEVEPRQAIPAEGVYATMVHVDGKTYRAMTNIGRCPTFGNENKCTIESYILDYNKALYGHELKVEIIERLRDEKRFDSIDELKKQIAEDVRRGNEILSTLGRE
jgi:riboflavin kinase/FMN adenylyltransferase